MECRVLGGSAHELSGVVEEWVLGEQLLLVAAKKRDRSRHVFFECGVVSADWIDFWGWRSISHGSRILLDFFIIFHNFGD